MDRIEYQYQYQSDDDDMNEHDYEYECDDNLSLYLLWPNNNTHKEDNTDWIVK